MAKNKNLPKAAYELIKDLVYLQNTSGVSIYEVDHRALGCIPKLIDGNSSSQLANYWRMLVWIAYTRNLLETLDYEVKVAAQNHAKVDEYLQFLNKSYRELDLLDPMGESFNNEYKKRYNTVNKKIEVLRDSVETLKRNGKKEFMQSFFVVWGILSAAYVGLLFCILSFLDVGLVLWQIVVAILLLYVGLVCATYFIFDWWTKKDLPKVKEPSMNIR